MVTKAILAKELTKSELSRSRRSAILCIDTLLDSISDSLSKGERIELRGFGSFCVKTSAVHRTGINGRIAIPEHGRIVFQPCDSLRRAVWNYGNRKASK